MQNKFYETKQSICSLLEWLNNQEIGEDIRWIRASLEAAEEQVTRARTCFNDSVHDETTERVFDLMEISHHVNDSDLEHTAKKFLVDPDMSDRQRVYDLLSVYVGKDID